MAERIQLKEPGSELVMLVRSVKAETIDKNDYWLFGNGAKELLVPQSSVKAQMEHMEIENVESMIGHSVRFARSMKMSRANKPYWDVGWGSGAEQSAGGGGNAGNPASAPPVDSAKPKMREAYKSLTEWVLREIAPLYKEAGLDVSPVAMAACCQTLFIQACNAGKVE